MNTFMDTLRRFFAGVYNTGWLTKEEADKFHWGLWKAIFFLICIIIIVWVVNIPNGGLGAVNVIFLIPGILGILFVTTMPRLLGISAIAGAGTNALLDRDLSQGAVEGVKWLFRIAIALLWGYTALTAMLIFWSFTTNPGAFWKLVVIALLVGTTYVVSGGKGFVPKLAAVLGVIFGFLTLWSTIPETYALRRGGDALVHNTIVTGKWFESKPPPETPSDSAKTREAAGPVYTTYSVPAPIARWSFSERTPAGKCIFLWDDGGPDRDMVLAQVRRINDATWHDVHTFIADAHRRGEDPAWTWTRFRTAPGFAESQEVYFQFRNAGGCYN